MALLYGVVADQGKMGIGPVGDTCESRFVRNVDGDRPVEHPLRIEGGVNLFVLGKPVDVNAGGRGIEVGAHKRLIPRYVDTHLLLEVIPHLGDHLGVHPVLVPDERDVFHDKTLVWANSLSSPRCPGGFPLT